MSAVRFIFQERTLMVMTGDYTVAKTALQDLQQNGNLKLQEKLMIDVFLFK